MVRGITAAAVHLLDLSHPLGSSALQEKGCHCLTCGAAQPRNNEEVLPSRFRCPLCQVLISQSPASQQREVSRVAEAPWLYFTSLTKELVRKCPSAERTSLSAKVLCVVVLHSLLENIV